MSCSTRSSPAADERSTGIARATVRRFGGGRSLPAWGAGMLAQLLTSEAFSFLFVFVRVGAAFMMLPGIGDSYVLPRFRLLLALMVSTLILPDRKSPRLNSSH